MTPVDAGLVAYLATGTAVVYLTRTRPQWRRQPSAPAPQTGTATVPTPDVTGWLRTSEVRQALGVKSDTTVKRLADSGVITSVRLATGERRYEPGSVRAAANGGGAR